jgi:hypothetical protein
VRRRDRPTRAVAAHGTGQGSHKRHEQQLGCGARTSGHWPASACVYGGVAVGRRGVPARRRARSHSRGKNVSD